MRCRAWTAEELQLLEDTFGLVAAPPGPKPPNPDIPRVAAVLGRTEWQVKKRLQRMRRDGGWSTTPKKPEPTRRHQWTDNQLLDLVNACGLEVQTDAARQEHPALGDFAERFGISRHAVLKKLGQIRADDRAAHA